MADGSVLNTDPPLANEAHVIYMPVDYLRPLISGIRLTLPPHATLIARGFPTDSGDHALRSSITCLYVNNFETPSSAQHVLAKASVPFRALAEWPQTRRNTATAHGNPLSGGNQHPHCLWLSSVIYSLSAPNYGGLLALLPGIHHAPDHDVDPQTQIPYIIRLELLRGCLWWQGVVDVLWGLAGAVHLGGVCCK
jgi:hypothetical protein